MKTLKTLLTMTLAILAGAATAAEEPRQASANACSFSAGLPDKSAAGIKLVAQLLEGQRVAEQVEFSAFDGQPVQSNRQDVIADRVIEGFGITLLPRVLHDGKLDVELCLSKTDLVGTSQYRSGTLAAAYPETVNYWMARRVVFADATDIAVGDSKYVLHLKASTNSAGAATSSGTTH